MKQNPGKAFPLKQATGMLFWITFLISVLVLTTAVFSTINSHAVYPSDELNQAYYPSDIGILLFGIPLLMITLWLLRKRKFLGILLWPGALFYMLYSYSLYLFGIPFGILSVVYMLIVSLSLYTLIAVLSAIKVPESRAKFSANTPTRMASIVLIALGAMILLRELSLIAVAISNAVSVSQIDKALWITDFVIGSPPLLIVGVLLWQRKDFAYISAPGLLLQFLILSLGLLPVFIYQANGSMAGLDMGGLLVVFVMVLLCAFPFYQFVKSSSNEKKNS